MRAVLKSLFKRLPLPSSVREKVRLALPYALRQPNPLLRRFGVVDELYPWFAEAGMDTRLFIQNYFSVFFPELDTATRVRLWAFDAEGRPLAERAESLAAMGTLDISAREWLGEKGAGTLFWHIVLPAAVARLPEVRENHAYFTDRGYIAYQSGGQLAFMHGVDRFAVFQETEESGFGPYYPKPEPVSWRPEMPLGPSLGCRTLEIVTVNRSPAPAEIELEVAACDGTVLETRRRTVPSRGLFREALTAALLERLGDEGSLRLAGLPTAWTRAIAVRRFANGSVSAMHC